MPTTQDYRYPSATQVSVDAIGPNGLPIPTESILIGGENPSGNLEPLQTDASGNLLVTIAGQPSTPLAVNLTEVGGAAVSLGQAAMASSLPVVIASNQSAVPISSTQLPPALGAQVTASSVAVNIASDQVVPISASALPLPAGAATASNQATEIVSLSDIDTATAALNARLAGALVPVAFNEIALTYIASGDGAGQIGTAVYKLSGTTVKTLTLTYNGSNQLVDVVAS